MFDIIHKIAYWLGWFFIGVIVLVLCFLAYLAREYVLIMIGFFAVFYCIREVIGLNKEDSEQAEPETNEESVDE